VLHRLRPAAYLAKHGSPRPRSFGPRDNHDPRAGLSKLTDWRARANSAQANSFEGCRSSSAR
jgi:uncharacterized MAPEG superfamily protein